MPAIAVLRDVMSRVWSAFRADAVGQGGSTVHLHHCRGPWSHGEVDIYLAEAV